MMYRTHALTSPITVTIKHILAAPVKLNFRRLTMYAPETRNTNKGYFKAAQKYEGVVKTAVCHEQGRRLSKKLFLFLTTRK